MLHESAVNYQNLIRDLAEMYTDDVAEVIVLELVANSLDARANQISVHFDPSERTLRIEDNGTGMNADQFVRYHDFAAGLKTRGGTIGFAGLGAKISFNIADQVITETRSRSFVGGSKWYLQSDKKLVWENIESTNLEGCGTRVQVRFRNDARLPYANSKDIAELLRRHYLPLFDPKFLELYERLGFYPNGLQFRVNGESMRPNPIASDFRLEQTHEFIPTKKQARYGYGIFGLTPNDYPLGQSACGVLLCTHGKVVKADLFGQFPGQAGPRVFGVVEVPDFINFLTTAKNDFTLRGKRHDFEALYGPIREEFKVWLKKVGIQSIETVGEDEARKLEKELQKFLDELPELLDFTGLSGRKQVLVAADSAACATLVNGIMATFPDGAGEKGQDGAPPDIGAGVGQTLIPENAGVERARPISRTSRRGPKITFVIMPERTELAWVEGNSVMVNRGHPSAKKAHTNSLAQRLHDFFAVAGAIQRHLTSENGIKDLMFVDRMMAAWGKK